MTDVITRLQELCIRLTTRQDFDGLHCRTDLKFTDHRAYQLGRDQAAREVELMLDAVDEKPAPGCRWALSSGVGFEGVYDTSCINSFQFENDGPRENSMNYCCYCGGKLEVNDD